MQEAVKAWLWQTPMSVEKKILSWKETAVLWLEDFRYYASIALNFLECFLYVFIGAACLAYSFDPLDNHKEYGMRNSIYKYLSCVMIAIGLLDGIHKIPVTYLVKNRDGKGGGFVSGVIKRLEAVRRFYIRLKLNRVIDVVGNLMVIVGIWIVGYSTYIRGSKDFWGKRAQQGQKPDWNVVLEAMFKPSGIFSLLSLGYSLYGFVMQVCQHIGDFRKRKPYSNNAGVFILFEEEGKGHKGADKEPFSNMRVLTLMELAMMVVFTLIGLIRGGAGYVKSNLMPVVIVTKTFTTVLQYMVPFLRHSGSKATILLPVTFIFILTFSTYISGLGARVGELMEIGAEKGTGKSSSVGTQALPEIPMRTFHRSNSLPTMTPVRN